MEKKKVVICIYYVNSEISEVIFSIDVWKISVSKVLFLINCLVIENMPNQYT